MVSIIDPEGHWKSDLTDLMAACPGLSKDRMGFPQNWHNLEFWQS